MRSNLAVVTNYPRPTDLVALRDEEFDDCIEGIKRVLGRLEKETSPKSTLRTFEYIVREFLIKGADERARVHARTFWGETIWALLKLMAFIKSHEDAVTAARVIQTNYLGQVRAMEKFHSN